MRHYENMNVKTLHDRRWNVQWGNKVEFCEETQEAIRIPGEIKVSEGTKIGP